MQILSSEVKQKGHVIGGISAALEHVREQHTDCDTKIKQLEGELSQWKKDHTHCSTQGATIADLEGELSQWKKDHTHCSTQSTTIARLEDEYQRVREQHRNCSTQGATIARLEGEYQRFREQHRNCSTQSTTIARLEGEYQRFREQHRNCSTQSTTIARLEGEYQRFREQHRNCSTQSATTTSLQQKLRDLGPSNRECSNQSDTATKLIGQAHGRQINGKRTEETVSIRRRTDATPQLMGEVDVHRATTVPDTTMASVSRIEASLKSVYMLASLCLAKGAERTDNPVSAKYKALEELVLKWGTSDIRGDYTDATRSASFVDLYRDLAVGFEKLAMSHMTQARDLQNMASKVVQLRADVFDLKADRDEWKRHCLAVLTKAESEQKAAHGRESALKEQLKGMAEFIGELQRLLGDDDNQKLYNGKARKGVENTVLQELAKIGDTEDHPHEISSRASSSTDGSEVDDSAGEKGSTAPALAKLTEGDNGDGQVADERPGDGKFVPQSATTSDDSLYRPPSPQIKAFAGNGANGVASSRGNSLAQSVRHTHTRGLEASSSVSDPTHDDGPDHTADSGVFDHTSDILVETQDEYPQRKSSYNYPEHAPDGLTVLAALAYQHAKVHGWIPNDMDDASWRATAVPLLCSMDSQVLNRLVHGRRLEPSISDRQQSKWATNGGTEAPVIYARAFCDGRTGRPITAGELRLVIARLRIYTTLEPTDDEVDLITGVEEQAPRNEPKDRHIRSGRRHFFGEQRLTADLHVRASKILSFCQRCEERMQHMEDSEDFRMLFYIGYTLVFTARMEQHRSASGNTSWFMNLFLATCKAVLISKKENWSFQDTALCFCVDETEVFVGEILMTLLSGAWLWDPSSW
ncbi:hypothetical protein SNOG_01320 [Parastagonospora nodorum SN15]|uniref:Uncharacterized protein n=1 Tax=Phaeosphaeria nodorum (strain SN15 / ATCC MYA-4574 / FGSC 10173) TaxID=321614 RepID=Q0V3U4_PHANO|nr:hypothetical protein SNOG_01320 [Parastagonospora nodorum SN15]EAT90969.2 hypothetical protein SNOG_01320 [Parastagonospora nodorum SN15]